MSLYTITFDSTDTESSDAAPNISDESESEDLPSLVSPQKKPKVFRSMRIIMDAAEMPKTQSKEKPLVTNIEVVREKKVKVNGTRIFFKAFHNNKQIFLAKAKHAGSKQIPITSDTEIHLKNQNMYDVMTENNSTDFTLVDRATQEHLLWIQFGAKTQSDELRKMFVTFLAACNIPKKLTSVPMKRKIKDIEGKMCKASVKNSLLEDENGNEVMTIRKVAKNRLNIEIVTGAEAIWLFAIGIAAFLGRKPTQ